MKRALKKLCYMLLGSFLTVVGIVTIGVIDRIRTVYL